MAERVSPADRWAKWRRAPLLNRVLLLWLVVALAIVFLFAFRGRSFFVSPAYLRILVWPCIGIGLLYAFAWFKLIPTLDLEWGAFKRFAISLVFGGVFGYWPLIFGIPLLAHSITSEPYEVNASVTGKTYESGGRGSRSCNRIFVRELEHHWFGKLCVTDEALNKLQPGDSINLRGSHSWFGVEIDTESAPRQTPA